MVSLIARLREWRCATVTATRVKWERSGDFPVELGLKAGRQKR